VHVLLLLLVLKEDGQDQCHNFLELGLFFLAIKEFLCQHFAYLLHVVLALLYGQSTDLLVDVLIVFNEGLKSARYLLNIALDLIFV
jgi:hypothetical protein